MTLRHMAEFENDRAVVVHINGITIRQLSHNIIFKWDEWCEIESLIEAHRYKYEGREAAND